MTDDSASGPEHGPHFHADGNVEGERRPLRSFSEEGPVYKGPKDVDAATRSHRLIAAGGALPGAVLGAALGVFLTAQGVTPLIFFVTIPAFILLVYGGSLLISGRAGAAAQTLYNPSGKTTPPKKEYSYAESLVVRGQYEEAADAFELAVAEDPGDPTPYLRIARIYRDHLERHEDAARWFRRAQRESQIHPGHMMLARRELVELYIHHLGEPQKAAPELARLAEEFEGTPEGEWAEEELKAVKEWMRARQDDVGPGA